MMKLRKLAATSLALLAIGTVPAATQTYPAKPVKIIVTWNAGAANVSGYSADEAVGRHISFLYPPDDVSLGRPTREMAQAERDGRSVSEGWRLRRVGERIWVSSTMLALREADGRVLGFCRSDRDTTEQLRAEQALRFSEAKFSGIIGISTDAIVSTDVGLRILVFSRGAEEGVG